MSSLNPYIQTRKAELHALCRTYGVERLALVGSATGAFETATSDLDFRTEHSRDR